MSQWANLRFEGALVTSELLQRVVALNAGMQSSSDYGLAPGTRIGDEIRDQWDRLRRIWTAYQAHRHTPEQPDRTGGTSSAHWQQPLLKALGFVNLTVRPALAHDGRSYPIARVWQVNDATIVPLHLVGACVPLDKRTAGATGAAADRPHAMLQAYLNAADMALWGIVTDGLVLRILRDTSSLSRPPYLEFDVAAIFDGNDFAGFTLLWLVAHASRFAGETPAACPLEIWSRAAAKEGTRALDALRDGVVEAIQCIGAGLVNHPANEELRQALSTGRLPRQDLLHEVLRLVYRILFVAVAEERGVLLDPKADPAIKQLYFEGYSLRRLRRMALELRGTDHGDLWRNLSFVFERLHTRGAPELGLLPLGSFLFAPASTPHVLGHGTHANFDAAPWRLELRNRDLLAALHALALVRDPETKKQRLVDYRLVGADELGSVYESLLELHLDAAAGRDQFRLAVHAGNERKTSGSYYTPDSLVQCLLDSALEPVVAQAVQGKRGAAAEEALLALKVCDPACGSGHFLVAAAHRLARHVARVRTGATEPTPDEHRTALRDVVRRCIYGIDINPMAAELCKIALWVESMEPGRPLSFLDHHIQVGNALIGATPKLLAEGIPEGAFEVLEGDEGAVVTRLKKQNKAELADRKRKQTGFDFEADAAPAVPQGFQRLSQGDDDNLAAVELRARTFADLTADSNYQHAKFVHDAWCAAFFWKKDGTKCDGYEGITEALLRDIERNPARYPADNAVRQEVARLAREHHFLHLHLAFPEVYPHGAPGGFDCILGNPPWERVKLQEKEWFAQRVPEIADAPNAAARTKMIKELAAERPELHAQFLVDVRAAEAASAFLRGSGRYPLCGRRDVNLYTIFTESMRDSVSSAGRVGCIVPSGIATDETTKVFFQDLVDRASLASLFHFDNREKLFEAVGPMITFCCMTLRQPAPDEKAAAKIAPAEFVFFAHKVEDLADERRRLTLTREDFALVNPNSKTSPIFRSKVDAELTKYIYRRVPVLVEENKPDGNPWGVEFSTMFHMSNDSDLFRTREQLERDGWTLRGNVFERGKERYLPLYEGRLGHQFDHRFSSEPRGELLEISEDQKCNPQLLVETNYWVPEGEGESRLSRRSAQDIPVMLGFRRVARSTDERTVIASLLPRGPASYGWILCFGVDSRRRSEMCAGFNSWPFDYTLRNAISQPSIPQGSFVQRPFPQSEILESLEIAVCFGTAVRVLELSATADDMSPFSKDLWPEGDGAVFRYDPERRFEIRCELDAAFFHLYLGTADEWKRTASPELLQALPTPRDAVAYIMETFPIVKRKDEEAHGHYRTKDRILALYDELLRCLASGQPFQSTLNPPPGPPTNPDGSFAKLPAWPKGAPKPTNWPAHIHPPVAHRS